MASEAEMWQQMVVTLAAALNQLQTQVTVLAGDVRYLGQEIAELKTLVNPATGDGLRQRTEQNHTILDAHEKKFTQMAAQVGRLIWAVVTVGLALIAGWIKTRMGW